MIAARAARRGALPLSMPISPTAVLLVLASAVAFALLDLLRKLLATRMRALPLLFFLAAGPVPFFLVWLLVAGGRGSGWVYWAPATASVALNVGANLAFLEAVRLAPLSLTIPVLSLTPVFTTVLAVPLLGEWPDAVQGAGILVVVLAIVWLQVGAAGGDRRGAAGGAAGRGALLMVLVALQWSLAMPLDKLAMVRSGVPFHGLVLNAGVALGVLLVLGAQGRVGELASWRRHLGLLAATVVVSVAALALVLLALTLTWVGLVETLKRGVGSFLALALGALVFREAVGARHYLAVLVMGAGVALILLG